LSYGCDPSCGVAKFDCDRNQTGIPCKPLDMCPPTTAGANATACPASGRCSQPQVPQCFCGQCNYTGIDHSIRNASELALDTKNLSYSLPRGTCNATGITAATIFFKEGWPTPNKVFEVSSYLPPHCGAKANVHGHAPTCGVGITCNLPNNTCGVNKTHPRAPSAVEVTAAVQATINAAAAAGNGAEAYFPKGSYGLTSTVLIKGTNHFYITGSGYQTQITGGGSCANASSFCGPLFSVAAGSHVTLGWMQIFPSNQTADMERIEIHGGGHTNVTINGVQMQGYNEGKREWASGIHVDGFVPSDVLDVIYTDGDMTATGNEGTIIVGFHLAGTVNLKPSGKQLAEYAVAAAKAAAGEGVGTNRKQRFFR
jgi:hypothetical protein